MSKPKEPIVYDFDMLPESAAEIAVRLDGWFTRNAWLVDGKPTILINGVDGLREKPLAREALH